jgi:hypothetical protein
VTTKQPAGWGASVNDEMVYVCICDKVILLKIFMHDVSKIHGHVIETKGNKHLNHRSSFVLQRPSPGLATMITVAFGNWF